MKIEQGRGIGASAPSRRTAGAAGAGFTVPTDAPQRTAPTAPAQAVTALDAILALQSDEPPAQRRARQARRGADALDALDELKAGLLAGRAPAALLARLHTLREAGETTGEAQLDAVLHEIDIRLAVEAAKLERQRSAA